MFCVVYTHRGALAAALVVVLLELLGWLGWHLSLSLSLATHGVAPVRPPECCNVCTFCNRVLRCLCSAVCAGSQSSWLAQLAAVKLDVGAGGACLSPPPWLLPLLPLLHCNCLLVTASVTDGRVCGTLHLSVILLWPFCLASFNPH